MSTKTESLAQLPMVRMARLMDRARTQRLAQWCHYVLSQSLDWSVVLRVDIEEAVSSDVLQAHRTKSMVDSLIIGRLTATGDGKLFFECSLCYNFDEECESGELNKQPELYEDGLDLASVFDKTLTGDLDEPLYETYEAFVAHASELIDAIYQRLSESADCFGDINEPTPNHDFLMKAEDMIEDLGDLPAIPVDR